MSSLWGFYFGSPPPRLAHRVVVPPLVVPHGRNLGPPLSTPFGANDFALLRNAKFGKKKKKTASFLGPLVKFTKIRNPLKKTTNSLPTGPPVFVKSTPQTSEGMFLEEVNLGQGNKDESPFWSGISPPINFSPQLRDHHRIQAYRPGTAHPEKNTHWPQTKTVVRHSRKSLSSPQTNPTSKKQTIQKKRKKWAPKKEEENTFLCRIN